VSKIFDQPNIYRLQTEIFNVKATVPPDAVVGGAQLAGMACELAASEAVPWQCLRPS